MVDGLIGIKVGMTQVFAEDGTVVPVTVIKAGPCVVVQKKVKEKDGYDAVQLGLVEFVRPGRVGKAARRPFQEGRRAAVPRPARVRLRRNGGRPEGRRPDPRRARFSRRRTRWMSSGPARAKALPAWSSAIISAAGAASHGSMFHRAPGSIGASAFPSRVLPGMRAAGHMGDETDHGTEPEGRAHPGPGEPAACEGCGPGTQRRIRACEEG